MKTVAYLRVSTAQQDAGSQRLAILEYARRQGLSPLAAVVAFALPALVLGLIGRGRVVVTKVGRQFVADLVGLWRRRARRLPGH